MASKFRQETVNKLSFNKMKLVFCEKISYNECLIKTYEKCFILICGTIVKWICCDIFFLESEN